MSTVGSNANPATATSWVTSTTNLQGAIDASASGDQVWVAKGTYKPGGNGNKDRNLSFSLKNGVAIYGGFAGSENSLADRPDVNPVTGNPASSTLSGILTGGASLTAVVANRRVNTTAELDGFVITGG